MPKKSVWKRATRINESEPSYLTSYKVNIQKGTISQYTSNKKILTSAVPCLVAQSYLTLCNPVDWMLPGSSVHGILQARILEWVATPSSRGSSQPRNGTHVSCAADRFFTSWATREDHVKTRFFFFLNWFTDSVETQINSSSFLKIEIDKLILKCIWEKIQEK